MAAHPAAITNTVEVSYMDRNPQGSASLDGLRLPLEREHLEAAKAMAADNKGAQWTAGQALFLLAGDPIESRRALGAFLWEVDSLPTSTIADMTGYSGQELREIVEADPISLFGCLSCTEPIDPRDRRHFLSLKRALRLVCNSRVGDAVVSELLCQRCTRSQLQLLEEEERLSRLARQARTARLRKMPFNEYRFTPEWQARRAATLSRAGRRCQTCGEQDVRLDVHHNTYENYGDERSQDLTVLCGECHGMFHGRLEDAS